MACTYTHNVCARTASTNIDWRRSIRISAHSVARAANITPQTAYAAGVSIACTPSHVVGPEFTLELFSMALSVCHLVHLSTFSMNLAVFLFAFSFSPSHVPLIYCFCLTFRNSLPFLWAKASAWVLCTWTVVHAFYAGNNSTSFRLEKLTYFAFDELVRLAVRRIDERIQRR